MAFTKTALASGRNSSEMIMTLTSFLRGTMAAILVASCATALHAEDVIRAVTFTPAQMTFARNFQTYVDKVNEAGEGVVRIQIVGGPETIPNNRLGEAQKNGIIDMALLPAGLYLNLVPEGDAFSGSNLDPMTVRANGGMDTINAIYEEKANTRILAHVDGGSAFYLWMTDKPATTEDGTLDLSGLNLRSSPLYRAFLEQLGATIVVQPEADVYTSLERGVVDGTGYPVTGIADYGWNKFLRYKVEPGFMQTDVLVSMNLDAYNDLSPEAKNILDKVSVAYEQESFEANVAETARQDAALKEAGMQVIELSGEQRETFLNAAFDVAWSRMAERDPTNVVMLKPLFFKEIE